MRNPGGRAWPLVAGLLSAASAAPANAEARMGILGGASFSTFQTSPQEEGLDFGTRTGLVAGAVVDVGLGRRLTLRLEPAYAQRGSELVLLLFGEESRGTLKLEYLELPVLLKVGLGSGRIQPYLIGGPTLAYKLSAKTQAEGESEDVSESFQRWDFGIAAGGGLEFPAGSARVFLEGRYNFGLMNTTAGEDAKDFSSKNRGPQVVVGVTFALGR